VEVLQHPCLAPRKASLDVKSAKEAIGLPKDSKLVSIFGFLGNYKGHDIAMDAMKLLPENYHLALVGGMHPESKDIFLDSLITRMPSELRNRIHITGWVDKATADRYFAATDAFLAPYRAETELAGSGAITWALSSGKPVVASKVDAFLNVNRIAECMLMITSGCIGELSWAIQKITSDAQLGQLLVQRATEFCIAHSWEASVAPILELYESLGVKTNTQSSHGSLKAA
jgi:glycosyltransferase involved in cell wall biosynthesis